MASDNKNWAKEYVLDPLTGPQPSEETGPGTHFRPPPESTGQSGIVTTPPANTNPFRTPHGSPRLVSSYPSPPKSVSPQKSPSSHRQEAFGANPGRRRGSSLGERYQGDMSHRPLDTLAKEKARADRSRHVVKKHHIQPDLVDQLDGTSAGGAYHHGGPYDATLYARNNSYRSSPVAAVASTNEQTLKATPRERLVDSLQGHRPLDGVAAYVPGEQDITGHVYDYEQGENMMTDLNPGGGAYKRWPGLTYHPDDIKGKSEPSYTIEESLKDHKPSSSEKSNDINLVNIESSHSRSGSGSAMKTALAESEDGPRRSSSLSKKLGEGLKKRIGSIKRHAKHEG